MTFPPNLSADNCDVTFNLVCPGDVTVTCDAELWDLSIYGNAYVETYSGNVSAGIPQVTYNLNSCNTGYIYRTWTVEDYNWNVQSCTQTITVGSNGLFGADDITWPGEYYEVTGCNPNVSPDNLPEGYGYPSYDSQECAMIGVSYSDQTFYISASCKKVVRKWQVMDWCQYDYNYNSGLWVFYQTIKISSGEIPEPEFPENIEANSYNCQNAEVSVLPITVDASSCGNQYTITNNSPYAFDNGSDISGVYPIGTTNVTVTVHYGCGKKLNKVIKVTVLNKKAPHVYCYAKLVTALMPMDTDNDGIVDQGMVEIWAKDLDKGSTASCGGGSLTFSFSSDPTDMVRTFTCDEVGENEVEMWVTDSKGAQAYCIVNLVIQNNSANIPNCQPLEQMPPDAISLFGRVASINNAQLENVSLEINDMYPEITVVETIDTSYELVEEDIITPSGAVLTIGYYDTIYTSSFDTSISQQQMLKISDNNGYYSFDSCLIKGKTYNLNANFTDFSSRGIDETDLKILRYYLDGKISFMNNFIYNAADVNLDGQVNEEDYEILESFINGDIVQLNQSKSWLFYAENMNTDETSDSENIELEKIPSVMQNVNFTAIKIGDLNADAFTIYERQKGGNRYDVEFDETEIKLVYPNPFGDKLRFDISSHENQILSFQFYTLDGKLVNQYHQYCAKGENHLLLETNNLSGGIYILKVNDENAMTLTTNKLIKI
ncbi:MAG: T9SS type A sorting domain-containing protein [Saprospiraceae bacterium]|nr:T9SS type A sorting domain-containing protein [Saprospiraceae bacterium]